MKKLPLLRALVALAAASLLPGTAGCSSLGEKEPAALSAAEREEVARDVEKAAQELAAGKPARVVERLGPRWRRKGMPPELRNRTEDLLGEAVDRLADPASPAAADKDELRKIYRQELPPRLRARAGVAAAERLLDEGSRIRSYRMIRKVEEALPNHAERERAGDVLARAGLSLIRDARRYWLFRRYDARGVAALEYLVVHYPMEPRCDEAYVELAHHYEADGDLDLAIERTEDMVFYHAESPLAVGEEARLPDLRLRRLERDSYDRSEILLARREIDGWLERHPGHELAGEVRAVQREALRRLAANDLVVARYYERIRSPFGARVHAERALEEANAGGAEREAAAAQALLASLPPPAEPAGAPPPPPDPREGDPP
ncbi:MAG: hypothetical protein AB1726_00845 [Planctomycetota bacterium]